MLAKVVKHLANFHAVNFDCVAIGKLNCLNAKHKARVFNQRCNIVDIIYPDRRACKLLRVIEIITASLFAWQKVVFIERPRLNLQNIISCH